jgi:DNA-3-methyladenine glycosylase
MAAMATRRGTDDPRLLCSGPGRLCQALAITIAHNEVPLDEPPFEIFLPNENPAVAVGARIGITRAVEMPWRFAHAGSRFISRKI